MLSRLVRVAIIACLIIAANFQVVGQAPMLHRDASSWQSIERNLLPAQDNEDLRVAYRFYEGPAAGEPQVFAKDIETEITPDKSGQWEQLRNDKLLWRAKVQSEGAYSLNLGFTKFFLPPSAQLWLADGSGDNVIGPITAKANNKATQWWSPIIPDDEVWIQVEIIAKERETLQLELTKVNHDFSGFGAVLSGSCNLDVICGEQDGYGINERYRDQINSVGRLIVDGRFNCTGSLVNNTRNDCTPYLLTADHCGITEVTAASVVVYWNYQNSTCRQPNSTSSGIQGNGSLQNFNSGSSLVARYDQTDFALVRLNKSIDPSNNAYYSGWDYGTTSVDTSFAVHHPSGDEKRISYDFDPLIFNVDRHFVQVEDWDIGTTEGGSSGSPLFSSEGFIIGHLSGGDASCGNDLYDDFGMFRNSWEGGGTPETRLRDWLDPLETGQTALEGRYCQDVATFSTYDIKLCGTTPSEEVIMTVEQGFNESAIVSVEVPEGFRAMFSQNILSRSQPFEMTLTADEATNAQISTINIMATTSRGSTSYPLDVRLDKTIATVPSNLVPQDGATDQSFRIDFSWQDDGNVYYMEIAESSSFVDLFYEEKTENNNVTRTRFAPNTTYYWRVRAENACGLSSYSEIHSFTTGNFLCTVASAQDVPINISLVPSQITSTITIPSEGNIADINIPEIDISHTYLSDLTIILISPSGTRSVLLETSCAGDNDLLAGFDDEADLINLECPLTTQNKFRPVTPLSAFHGEPAQGDWTLLVVDGADQDGGQLNGWKLDICALDAATRGVSVNPSPILYCEKEQGPVIFDVLLNAAWEQPSLLTVATLSGTTLQSIDGESLMGRQVSVRIDDASQLEDQQELQVTVQEGEEIVISNVLFQFINDSNLPELLEPMNQEAAVVPRAPMLTWSNEPERFRHRVVVARDNDLSTIVIDTLVLGNTIELPNLEELTTYFWQVTAIGQCSDSSSEIFQFTTDMIDATDNPIYQLIEVHPTVSEDLILLTLPQDLSPADLQYSIYNLMGQEVSANRLTERETRIDVSHFYQGAFLIKIGDRTDFTIRKFVKL